MYQNRVNPVGEIFKTTARGTLMGNRGVIHDDRGEIKKSFKTKAWITCLLKFKDRKFTIMAPGRWTALFFLDEATAFAAGHRPCSECRHKDFKRFKSFWIKGNPEYGFDIKTRIAAIDEVIHTERINSGGNKVMFEMNVDEIPNGTFVVINSTPFLFFESQLYEWSPTGYKTPAPLPNLPKLSILTPRSVVRTLIAGYDVGSSIG
jgi:hypothetical protein